MYCTRADTIGPADAAQGMACEVTAAAQRVRPSASPGHEDAIELSPMESDDDSEHAALDFAVRSQMRDNLALGETLVSLGLMDPKELESVDRAQRREADVVESLVVTSTLRSRLGDILLRTRQITSNQLERALEIQREQGGLLGEILIERGWIVSQSLERALATQERAVA
jgi:hypothetical protein